MKLKLDRSIISILLTILLLGGCGKSNGRSTTSTPNLQTTNPSKSLDSERFLFMRDDKYGYIDRTGKIAISAQFEEARNFSEGLATVKIGKKYSYVDRTGKIAIPAQFEEAKDFSEGLATVRIGKKYGCIDTTGKIVVPARFNVIYKFENGVAEVDIDSKTEGKIDRTGKLLLTKPLSVAPAVASGSDGLILVEKDGKYGYKNRAGKILIPARFDSAAEQFVEGMAWVIVKDRIGYINDRGKIIVAPQFHGLRVASNSGNDFEGGLAKVCLNSKCGYINKTGKIVIPLQFNDAATKFSNGLAWVGIGNRVGYIDKNGKVVIPARYLYPPTLLNDWTRERVDNIRFYASTDFDRGLAAVAIPEKCGFFNFDDCVAYGYIDTTGKLVFKF